MAETIAQRIRALREQKGWSKIDLGRRVGVKNGRVTVLRWESGVVVPSPASVDRLASIFGVPKEEVDPTGSAYSLTGPRRRSRGVDNLDEVGRIPYSQPPTTTTEGQTMRDQLKGLEGALSIVPEEHRERFIHQVQRLAAKMLLDAEEPGALPGKRARASGKG